MIYPSTASNRNYPIIVHSSKQYAYDENGKEYLDFIGGNNTVVLGHKRFKFKHTPIYSGKSILEDELSNKLKEYTGNDYYRYFKNGSDSVSCAIRLSRHILGGEDRNIFFLGYHGANNEYVYTVNPNGIDRQNTCQIQPDPVKDVSEYLEDNSFVDILVFESRYSHIADNINARIKICDHLKSGIMGLHEPTYDFDLYGKSIGNGYPISVITGKDEYMERINEIYYSTTFGGDNLGLEAALRTINEFESKEDIYLNLMEYAKDNLPEWDSAPIEVVNNLLDKGILYNGNWQIMLPHSKKDILRLKRALL